MRDKVEKALDKIRPMLAMDESDIEVVEVNDGVVKIKLIGACVDCGEDCPISLNDDPAIAVEALLKQEVPEIKEVVNVDEI